MLPAEPAKWDAVEDDDAEDEVGATVVVVAPTARTPS